MPVESQLKALIADVGGTNIRCALVDDDQQFGGNSSSRPDISGANEPFRCIASYRCVDFDQLGDALKAYLQKFEVSPKQIGRIGLALPGPIHRDPVTLVNNPWVVSKRELQEQFGTEVFVMNDFTAQALAITALPPENIRWLRQSKSKAIGAPRVIIGPGTGLGVAALMADGTVVESEAGHTNFAPIDSRQIALLSVILDSYDTVSNERMASGPGIANIYRAMQLAGVLQGGQRSGDAASLTPETITERAREGNSDCLGAINEFTRILGGFCGDMALNFGALQGVYLTGALLRELEPLIDWNNFLYCFDNKGDFRDYCREIPLALIEYDHPGLLGVYKFLSDLPKSMSTEPRGTVPA